MTFYRSPLRYPGGKQKALSQIAQYLPPKMGEYREPMVGGGSVFLMARSAGLAEKYWINDLNYELWCFWNTSKNRLANEAVRRELTLLLESCNGDKEYMRSLFKEKRSQYLASTTIEHAVRFFFLNRASFSGTTEAGGFSGTRFNQPAINRIEPMSAALQGVQITKGDYSCLLDIAGDDVFCFLDPPYPNAKKLYGREGALQEFDHDLLAHRLKHCKDKKWLLTYPDIDWVREMYEGWAHIYSGTWKYGMNNCSHEGKQKDGKELFICNYEVVGG